jgi:hypothetical protein
VKPARAMRPARARVAAAMMMTVAVEVPLSVVVSEPLPLSGVGAGSSSAGGSVGSAVSRGGRPLAARHSSSRPSWSKP